VREILFNSPQPFRCSDVVEALRGGQACQLPAVDQACEDALLERRGARAGQQVEHFAAKAGDTRLDVFELRVCGRGFVIAGYQAAAVQCYIRRHGGFSGRVAIDHDHAKGGGVFQSPGGGGVRDGQQRIAIEQQEAFRQVAAGIAQRAAGALRLGLTRIAEPQAKALAAGEICLDLLAQIAREQQHVAERLPRQQP